MHGHVVCNHKVIGNAINIACLIGTLSLMREANCVYPVLNLSHKVKHNHEERPFSLKLEGRSVVRVCRLPIGLGLETRWLEPTRTRALASPMHTPQIKFQHTTCDAIDTRRSHTQRCWHVRACRERVAATHYITRDSKYMGD